MDFFEKDEIEDRHFHWNVYNAVRELINEGALVEYNQNSPLIKSDLDQFKDKNILKLVL